MLDIVARPMLYPASPMPVPSPPPSPFEEVALETEHGRLIAWFAEGRQPKAPAVLLFHGNGENLETMRFSGQLDLWRGPASSILAVDYPGYGRSGGTPSEASLVEGGIAACEALRSRRHGARVVVAGWSLGAAVASQVAARCAVDDGGVDGLILASPWHDLPSLASEHFPGFLVKAALKDRYDSAEAVRALRPMPVLLVHGATDRIIPIDHGRRLHAVTEEHLGDRVTWVEVPGTGHNDLFTRDAVWSAIREFVGATGDSSTS